MAGEITPEMARAELARRRGASAPPMQSGGITPEMARAELERRRSARAPAVETEAPVEGGGILRTVDDAVRGAADMLTLGQSDEIAAKLGEWTGIGGEAGNYDANLEAQRTRDDQGGAARMVGQVAGALMLPGAAAGSMGRSALQGAAMGGAYGFGSGEGGLAPRLESAGIGAATGGAVGGAVRGVTNTLTKKAAQAAIPSNEVIRRSADAAYKAADEAGVIIKPQSTARLTATIKEDLADFGYDSALQPGIGAVLNRLDGLADQNVTLKGLDIIRRVAANAAKDPMNPSQQAAAAKVIDHIDDFVGGMNADDVLAGNSREAANKMLLGRSLWSRLKKSEAVDTAAIKADLRAASTGSGGNVDNALRQNVRRLIENPKTSRGMTDAEKAAAERVVRGTKGQNALRLAGKLSPQGNGLMAALGVGGAMTNPVLGIPALVGVGAKAVADRSTVKNAEFLSQIIRSGGKSARDLVEMATTGEGPPELVQAVQALLARDQSLRAAGAPLAASMADRVTN